MTGKKTPAPVWAAFRVKRQANGDRTSYRILKSKDGKDCKYYHVQVKGDYTTSTLNTHVRIKHPEDHNKIFGSNVEKPTSTPQKKMTDYAFTQEALQKKADTEIIEYIARRNESFSVVEDKLVYPLLVNKYGTDCVKKMNYYRTTGLQNAADHYNQQIQGLIKDSKIACTADLWSKLSADFSLMVITATLFDGWQRRNIILSCNTVVKPHNSDKIMDIFDKTCSDLNIEKENIVFITRDDGSDIKKACQDLSITAAQCGPHALNNILQAAFSGDPEEEEMPMLKKKSQTLSSSFSKNPSRRRMLALAQKEHGLNQKKIPRIIEVRFNSAYLCFNEIVNNEKALKHLAVEEEEIYLEKDDFKSIKEATVILKYFYDETLKLSKRESIISEIIPSFYKLKDWIDNVAIKKNKFKCISSEKLLKILSSKLAKKLDNYARNRYITSAMVLDPRYSGNKNYLKEIQWDAACSNVVSFVTRNAAQGFFAEDIYEEPGQSNSFNSNASISSTDLDPNELEKRRSKKPTQKNTGADNRKEIKDEIAFIQERRNLDIKPFEFYEINSSIQEGDGKVLKHVPKAAKHFLLASSSFIESESFFSDATSLYGNKQRNRMSGEAAQVLLLIKVMQKQNISNAERNEEETEESESEEEFLS